MEIDSLKRIFLEKIWCKEKNCVASQAKSGYNREMNKKGCFRLHVEKK
jgi:hypothetical protein